MEAPLHHSPVPLPAPMPAAPPRQRDDAIIVDASAILQAAAATSVTALHLQKPPTAMADRREQCPRCASRDTKFCYYNNYNTAQPRHFCRACRRYWTLGGSLRNVPVGGSSRKRPRPARGPARAVANASSSAATTTTVTAGTGSSCGGPFATSLPLPAPALATAQNGGGLLNSLLLGSVPLLEGRLRFDLGLGQPAGSTGAGDLLGFGAGPLLWPSATTLSEGDRAETISKPGGGVFPPPAAVLWQELAAAMPAAGVGGLHQNHGMSQLLL
jgi:hypothetical protein